MSQQKTYTYEDIKNTNYNYLQDPNENNFEDNANSLNDNTKLTYSLLNSNQGRDVIQTKSEDYGHLYGSRNNMHII